jgi:hypothetical protein
VAVNQRLAPNDLTAGGATWEALGNFTITGTTLVVQLTDAANGAVDADAIRIERLPALFASIRVLRDAPGIQWSSAQQVETGSAIVRNGTIRTRDGSADNTIVHTLFFTPNGISINLGGAAEPAVARRQAARRVAESAAHRGRVESAVDAALLDFGSRRPEDNDLERWAVALATVQSRDEGSPQLVPIETWSSFLRGRTRRRKA